MRNSPARTGTMKLSLLDDSTRRNVREIGKHPLEKANTLLTFLHFIFLALLWSGLVWSGLVWSGLVWFSLHDLDVEKLMVPRARKAMPLTRVVELRKMTRTIANEEESKKETDRGSPWAELEGEYKANKPERVLEKSQPKIPCNDESDALSKRFTSFPKASSLLRHGENDDEDEAITSRMATKDNDDDDNDDDDDDDVG
uniref:Uncharacterized protein n=1 Tax=Vespula pensylvanica TaxID=30213 RepID=A0A834JM57_VESPE|nr:hypothetical protein H0235_017667 [Vespula pensylvanica]